MSVHVLAFDRATVRTTDEDGRLHVAVTNISKANVCPYLGKEIPDAETLGLDPDRVYMLLRDPDELAKAAPTFNNLPVLSMHVPVSADDHQPDLVVGSTGTDAEFSAPYLRNSLVIWAADAIDGIETGEQRELSSAYRYVADMTPGTFGGEKYDGVMREIRGNHVALVAAGRAGSDVIVGDSAMGNTGMKRKTLSRKAAMVKGALLASVKFATDAKPDLSAILADVTAKNFKAKSPDIIAAIKPKLAADADLEGVVKLLDMLDHEVEEDDDGNAMDDDGDDDMDAMDGEGLSEEEEAQYQALLKRRKPEAAMDEPPEFEGKPKGPEKAKSEAPTKTAMDAAIAKTRADTIADMNAIRAAEKAVFPHVGELAVAMDSAAAVYKFALDAAHVETKGVHPSAFAAMVKMLPLPGSEPAKRELAMDGKADDDFAKRYPGAARIRSA